MAKMTFKAGDDYALKLSRLYTQSSAVAQKALYAAAAIVTDEVRKNLEALPEDKFRRLQDGEMFTGVPKLQKKDLLDSLGVTPIDTDKKGNWNVKIGFDGYGSMPTKKYTKGVPNPMLARAIESGSSVRKKTPFVRPAVKATKAAAVEAMNRVIDAETKKIMGG